MTIEAKDLKIVFNGRHYRDIVICLNSTLVGEQGVSLAGVEHIKSLHVKKLEYFEKMEDTDDVNELKALAREVLQIEFELQRSWGFPEDVKFHEWYKVPKCTCPNMDNDERRGTAYCIINGNCPIHGSGRSFADEFDAGYKKEYTEPVNSILPPLVCTLNTYDACEVLRYFFDEEEIDKLRYEGDTEFPLKLEISRIKD